MPARRFFSILNASRELENEKRWNFIVELCDVSNISNCTQEHKEEIQKYYLSRILNKGDSEKAKSRQIKVGDPTGAQVLTAIFATKAKVEGYGRR